jgi:tetratricopeptide (TPR) repeat protein
MNRNADTLAQITAGLNRLTDAVERSRLNTACHFARSGQYAQAQREIEGMAFSNVPNKIEASLLMGKIFAQMGYLDRAAAYWNHVLKSDPNNQEAHRGLAALARQSAKPLPFRALAFVAGCLFIVLLAAGFGIYIHHQLDGVHSDIAAMESSHRRIAATRGKQIEDLMATLKQNYASLSSESSKSKEALASKLDRIMTAFDKRQQSLTKLAEEMASFEKAETRRYNRAANKLASLAAVSAARSLALRRKAESDSRKLYEELSRIQATIQLNRQAIERAMEK